MLESFQNVFRIPELKRRVLFTIALLCVYRLGGHVPTPGVNSEALVTAFASQANSLFGLYDLFVGGSFAKATVFALGIMPYISASIILQLLGAVVPYFEKLQKEGEEGRKKITQYTRLGTVGLSAVQSIAYWVIFFRPSSPSFWSFRSEEHTSELQSLYDLVCRLLLEKKKQKKKHNSSAATQSACAIQRTRHTYPKAMPSSHPTLPTAST